MQRVAPSNLRGLLFFAYMQALDLLSTLAFLLGGVEEANPIVRIAMGATSSPVFGLLAIKAAGVLLGVYCWRSGRTSLLEKVNVFYAALVAYNLCCLILGLAGR